LIRLHQYSVGFDQGFSSASTFGRTVDRLGYWEHLEDANLVGVSGFGSGNILLPKL
jgi:hypothetical protein